MTVTSYLIDFHSSCQWQSKSHANVTYLADLLFLYDISEYKRVG